MKNIIPGSIMNIILIELLAILKTTMITENGIALKNYITGTLNISKIMLPLEDNPATGLTNQTGPGLNGGIFKKYPKMLTSISGLLNGNPGSITLLKKTEPGALQLIMRTIMNGIALNNYKSSILDTSLIESKKKNI
jgi:hypothetical protein